MENELSETDEIFYPSVSGSCDVLAEFVYNFNVVFFVLSGIPGLVMTTNLQST
jgi:hypothetical protein